MFIVFKFPKNRFFFKFKNTVTFRKELLNQIHIYSILLNNYILGVGIKNSRILNQTFIIFEFKKTIMIKKIKKINKIEYFILKNCLKLYIIIYY